MNFQTCLTALALSAGFTLAQAQTKVGIIHLQQAIVSTKDGQKAGAELQAKYDPKKKTLEAKQSEIAALQQELNKGSNTMAEAKRVALQRDIDQKSRALTRETQDAEEEFQTEQRTIINKLGGDLMVVIDKYAKEHAYTLILDVSSPDTPVLFAANGVDITKEIIELYDKNSPSNLPAATPGAKPAAPPAKPPSAAKPKP